MRQLLFAILVVSQMQLEIAVVRAHTTTIAVTGDSTTDGSAGSWDDFAAPALNNDGAVAFGATLQQDGAAITTDNDFGIWLFDNANRTRLAQTGSGNVPGVADADFALFDDIKLSETSAVFATAELAAGVGGITTNSDLGIWRWGENETLIARTGSNDVPGVPTANYAGFLADSAAVADFAISGDDRVALNASMEIGVGGVVLSSDRGVWTYSDSGTALLAREGSFGVPDVSGASFNTFARPVINSNDQTVIFASLQTGGSVTLANASGIWRYSGAAGELLARTDSGNVPMLPDASFSKLRNPLLNNMGQVAFRATVSTAGSNATQTGVWLYSENSEILLAISENGNVPGVLDAEFHDFWDPTSINESGQVLTFAILRNGVGGVTSDNGSGLWLLGDTSHLVARRGSGDVPGVADADFSSFTEYALNEQGQVAILAELEIGVGGVDSTNDGGLWIVDPAGDSWLVAREGDQLAGQTIASLNFAGDGENQSTGFNDLGELAFEATFSSGDSGLFLFRPYAADFQRDGDVDADDLAEWQSFYADAANADADSDGDSDGADFLVWQRDFGSGSPSTPMTVAVPEPSAWMLLLVGIAIAKSRSQR